jgi:hypothetical protein
VHLVQLKDDDDDDDILPHPVVGKYWLHSIIKESIKCQIKFELLVQ